VEEQDYKYLVGLKTTQNMAVNILQQKCTAKLQLLAVLLPTRDLSFNEHHVMKEHRRVEV
jgi:hypothetical protein